MHSARGFRVAARASAGRNNSASAGVPLLVRSSVRQRCSPDRWAHQLQRTLDEAIKVLGGLHRLGVQHGDLNYRNIVVDGSEVSFIDLDDTVYTGRLAAPLELATFMRATVLPVLGPRRAALYIFRRLVTTQFIWLVVGGLLGLNVRRVRRFFQGIQRLSSSVFQQTR